MAVAKKNRRPIDVDGRRYLWYVAEDFDDFPRTVDPGNLHALNILSEDKRFIVRYHLGQDDSPGRHVTVIGDEFAGRDSTGPWRRFLCPDWCPDGIVTPGTVRAIIEWCLDETPRIEVDYRGEVITDGTACP